MKGTRLLELDASGELIFLPADENAVCKGIDIDLKQCSFTKDGNEIVAALPPVSSLTAKFIQEKTEAAKTDKKNKKKNFNYYFDINGVKFPCPAEYADRILAGGGKDVLKNELSIHVSLSAAKIANEGIVGTVEDLYDYGDKRYAKCKVKEEYIFIEVPEGFAGNTITFVLQAEEVAVFDTVHGIRYI